MKSIEEELTKLPASPGVYFFKDSAGEVIYIGKAASLKSRVRQYFQKSRPLDIKTNVLVSEIVGLQWRELETEADALFLEAELVRRYQPRYNILLRDDKSQLYVRVDYKSDYPTVSLVRRPLDDGAYYFGPYLNSLSLKRALRYLRRAFPYATSKSVGQRRVSLHYHLGLDPGLEENRTSLAEYRSNLRKLMRYLKGERVFLTKAIEKDMKEQARLKNYEKAAELRNQLYALQQLSQQVLFSDRERLDLSRDEALLQLATLLNLKEPPRRIEGFDISHLQATDTVASMVVFSNGVPDKASYRKFKVRGVGNDDYAHLKETLSRRFREENRRKWGLPDLILIDGGKGQLKAGITARDAAGLKLPAVGLAKRQEEIIVHKSLSVTTGDSDQIKQAAVAQNAQVEETEDFLNILLPKNSAVTKLLQRIRDESHRFAISYHSSLRRKRQTSSLLDEVPGLGPITKKKLIKHFGSTRAVLAAGETDLQVVLGKTRGAKLSRHLTSLR